MEQDIVYSIHHAVNEVAKNPKKELTAEDYDLEGGKTVYELSRGKPDDKVDKHRTFQFKDYAAQAFHHLREEFGYTPEQFLASWDLDTDKKLEITTARSGSMFYRTKDEKFLFKTILHPEVNIMMTLLEDYHKHYKKYKGSFMVKIYGLFRFQYTGGDKCWILIMGNTFPIGIKMDEVYDLKGRTPKPHKAAHERDRVSTGAIKDNEITRTLNIAPEDREFYKAQLVTDITLLMGKHIMDYSLLVGVHRLTEEEKVYKATKLFTKHGRLANTSDSCENSKSDVKNEIISQKSTKKDKSGKKDGNKLQVVVTNSNSAGKEGKAKDDKAKTDALTPSNGKKDKGEKSDEKERSRKSEKREKKSEGETKPDADKKEGDKDKSRKSEGRARSDGDEPAKSPRSSRREKKNLDEKKPEDEKQVVDGEKFDKKEDKKEEKDGEPAKSPRSKRRTEERKDKEKKREEKDETKKDETKKDETKKDETKKDDEVKKEEKKDAPVSEDRKDNKENLKPEPEANGEMRETKSEPLSTTKAESTATSEVDSDANRKQGLKTYKSTRYPLITLTNIALVPKNTELYEQRAQRIKDFYIDPSDPASNVFSHGGIFCVGENGEEEILFIGIIDNLTGYGFNKKVANFCKTMIWKEETLSTVQAQFYKERFETFMTHILLGEEAIELTEEQQFANLEKGMKSDRSLKEPKNKTNSNVKDGELRASKSSPSFRKSGKSEKS